MSDLKSQAEAKAESALGRLARYIVQPKHLLVVVAVVVGVVVLFIVK